MYNTTRRQKSEIRNIKLSVLKRSSCEASPEIESIDAGQINFLQGIRYDSENIDWLATDVLTGNHRVSGDG